MLNLISFLIILVGAANWMSIGMLQYDFVAGLFGTQASVFSRIIYIIVGFAAIYLIIMAIKEKGRISVYKKREKKEQPSAAQESTSNSSSN